MDIRRETSIKKPRLSLNSKEDSDQVLGGFTTYGIPVLNGYSSKKSTKVGNLLNLKSLQILLFELHLFSRHFISDKTITTNVLPPDYKMNSILSFIDQCSSELERTSYAFQKARKLRLKAAAVEAEALSELRCARIDLRESVYIVSDIKKTENIQGSFFVFMPFKIAFSRKRTH